MSSDELASLIEQGIVERVRADDNAARRDLAAAATHLLAASEVATLDPTGAFALAYDAMRKAILAHMRLNGVRVTSRPGAHERTGRYARVLLSEHGVDEHLAAFDDLRRVRNKTEYDALIVAEETAREAIDHAQAIVEAVERDVP